MTKWTTKLPSRLLGCACLLASVTAYASTQADLDVRPQTVLPGIPTTVILSNTDVNRVVCLEGNIDGYHYSEEKGALVEDTGADAFIKFRIRQAGDQVDYVVARNEFHFVCDGETYTLVSAPQDVVTQIVYLSAGRKKSSAENRLRFGPMSDEERALSITMDMLKDEIPTTFSIKPIEGPFERRVVPKMDVRIRREISIDGTNYSAREFLLRARMDVALDERQFLKPFFGDGIYSVTLDKTSLEAGEIGRLVIVYRGAKS